MFSILCVVPIYLFNSSWIQRFLFIKGLELLTVVRCSDRCKIKGTFGEFPTAQCFLQLESDILPTLAGLLYYVVSAVYFHVDFRRNNTRFGIFIDNVPFSLDLLSFKFWNLETFIRTSVFRALDTWSSDLQVFNSEDAHQSFQSSESSEHEKSHRLQRLSPFIRTSGLRASRQCLWASCLSRQSVTLSRVRS